MAKLIYNEELNFGNYYIKIVAWKLKKGHKYSFVLVKNGERILGFDNHENKEPHVHIKGKELPYNFVNIQKALYDFWEKAGEVIEDEESDGKV